MTNSERSKVLEEQADFLDREARSLKSRFSGFFVVSVSFSPDEVTALADRLEAIGKYVKSVADDLRADG